MRIWIVNYHPFANFAAVINNEFRSSRFAFPLGEPLFKGVLFVIGIEIHRMGSVIPFVTAVSDSVHILQCEVREQASEYGHLV